MSLIPFDVWINVASHLTLPYVYYRLCLTHPLIFKSIKHLKNNFFNSLVIKFYHCSLSVRKEKFINVVDFGVDTNRLDVYLDERRVSLSGLNKSAKRATIMCYESPSQSLFGVFTEKGDIHCIIDENNIVTYRDPLIGWKERHIFSQHGKNINTADDSAYFAYCVKSVIQQVDDGLMDKSDRDYCAALLLKNKGDVVQTIFDFPG